MRSVSPLASVPALLWVPSLYLAMGIPTNVIMGGTAVRMYKSLGHSDAEITIALGSIGVAWSLKPVWAAFLGMYRTKKFFILTTELLIAALFAGLTLTLPTPGFFQLSLASFWIAAFASATHDICSDGLYLTSLPKSAQARFAGLQGAFWVLAKVLVTGVLISVLDRMRVAEGWSQERMWATVLLVSAVAIAVLAVWHFFILPPGVPAPRRANTREVAREFIATATGFFHKRMFWGMIAFVFLYRLGEGLILMEAQLFLQSPVSRGGLGLSAGEVSTIDAVWGTLFSMTGGLLGSAFAARLGLARSLAILGLCLNVPHLAYVYLSQIAAAGQGADYLTIATLVSIEKFGYGFGFVGNMIYMMQQLAPGRYTMTHYAFATALMNLVLVPTNMISGPLAEWLGFSTFFVVVMIASVPSVWVAWRAPFPLATGDAAAAASPDDPAALSVAEQNVQSLAGRASMFAMLNILVLLIVDSRILGSLQGRAADAAWGTFGFLIVSAAVKIFLAQRSLRFAREAAIVSAADGATPPASPYLANARGARIATAICGAVGVVVLGAGAWLAF